MLYDFVYTTVEDIDVTRDVILWNLLDFDHVNHFHTKSYHHCKVLAVSGNARLIEYGVKHGFGSLFVKTYVMWHHFIPPGVIEHISPGLFGGYNRIRMKIDEFQRDGRTWSRLEHVYRIAWPGILKPLEGLLRRYMDRWSRVLWEEDGSMLRRRQKVLESGFKDYASRAGE